MPDPTLFAELVIRRELKELISRKGFESMTPVQQRCIPEFLKKDVIVQSQTGSGKTLSYLIPIFNSISVTSAGQIHALIIVPTRELCIQVREVVNSFMIRCEILMGGTPIEEDCKKLDCDVVVGTPGRLFEVLGANSKAFSRIRYLVLDESDKLLGFGFGAKLLRIVDLLPRSRTTGLFSATVDDSVSKLSQHALNNPSSIRVSENIPDRLRLKYKIVDPKSKIDSLLSMVDGKKAIVFFATCNSVEFFHNLFTTYGSLNKEDFHGTFHKIHGKMDQKDRNMVYSKFESLGGTLLCTDVAARGIDFKHIDIVVHFDIPKEHSNIVHRSGRTARNGLSGDSVVFLMPSEKAFIDFLKLKGIDIKEEVGHCDRSSAYEELKGVMNKVLLGSAVKAFVSYIRSYKEHVLNYVLNYKDLDYDGLVELYFLEKIPSMVELKHIKFKHFDRPEPAEKKGRKKRRLFQG